ncbi:MAG TPA: ATP-binding protein [Verrucomicrobiae bacterium]|nr:ATP-binding protein [Verrucomicrobiae bacterium]
MASTKHPPVVTPKIAELERERLISLINSMGDGVVAIDENFKIVVTNGAALNILDINTSLANRKVTDILHLIDKNNKPIKLEKLIADTKTSLASRDWKLKYADNNVINLYTSIAPVRLGYGQKGMKGYVILLRDITREKSLEEERDEFISVASHELRTPLAIAEGNISNAEFIFHKSGSEDKAVSDALAQAHTQITFLAGLVNDLATLSRAERGNLTLDIESINAHEVVNEVAKAYQPEAAAKQLGIKTELDPSLELIKSGKLYVREILQNFVTNAIKYTEKGHVTIGARKAAGGVKFYVADTGIGISKTDQQKVFEKFFRSEDYRTRVNNGTGLGLYVTQKLASLLKAKIEVESELDKGSTFTIFIPNLR